MKKLITCVISAACVCALALGIAACGDGGENPPAHTHELTKVGAVSATFFENGNSEYYTCDCGKYFSDSEGKNEIKKGFLGDRRRRHHCRRVRRVHSL